MCVVSSFRVSVIVFSGASGLFVCMCLSPSICVCVFVDLFFSLYLVSFLYICMLALWSLCECDCVWVLALRCVCV